MYEIVNNLAWGLSALLLIAASVCAFTRSATLLGMGFGVMALSALMGILFYLFFQLELVYDLDGLLVWFWPVNNMISCAGTGMVIVGILQIPKTSGSS